MMSIAKISAGDGYLYLLRHTARGDGNAAAAGAGNDAVNSKAASYYTAEGNPPGQWTGRGAHLLGLDGRQVTEEQMKALFGVGAHPDAGQMIRQYLREHVRAGMTDKQVEELRDEAIRHATLGRRFPEYETLDAFDDRVNRRLDLIREQAGRDPTQHEVKKVKADEARRQRAAVAGFDLVFSPVKSASLLWAVDPRPEVREAIRTAHQRAVKEAMAFIEDHAAYTRAGTGGIAQIETGGLIAATFEHWDSRAGDPDLHTHVAVSSKVQGVDGKWRSLDARGLYRLVVAASELYNTAFETHLTALTGAAFTPRPGTPKGKEPVREIDGVPLAAIDHFSRRRAVVEKQYSALLRDYRETHGREPSAATAHKLAQQAALDNRPDKQPPRSLQDRQEAWRSELAGRFGAGALDRIMQAIPSSRAEQVTPAQVHFPDLNQLSERIIASVSARRSTWTRWNIRAEAERVLRTEIPGLTPGQHAELAQILTDLAIDGGPSICVEAPCMLDEPDELRRSDGESVFTEHGAGRFTSEAVLGAEQRLLNATRTPTVNGLAGPSVAAAIDGFEAVSGRRLDAGQRALVTAFACDGRLLLAGIGPAGSGKTTAMRAYAHVLRQAGHHLIPLATSAASADVLGKELSLPAENLHKFLYEWTSGRAAGRLRSGAAVPSDLRKFALRPGDVVLVDEAGMAGTFLLDQLVTIASSRGATVRLLGDDRQLSAVESGGALRLVAAQPGTPELTVLHRFADPAEGEQTLKIRSGDGSAVDWYYARGRIRAGSRDAMTRAAYDGWKADMLAGKTTLMAAGEGTDVTELSARARADRVAAGQVEAGGAVLRDGNLAGAGDWIITRLNERRMSVYGGRDWVKNGDAWTVEHRHADGSLTVRHMDHGGRVTLPAAYVAACVQLLYATSAHRAQGSTVDTAHPLITPTMTREMLYVLATRARERTTFYTVTHELPFDEDAHVDRVRLDPDAQAGREVLLNVVATEGAALSATETIEVAQDEAGSLATLVPRYLHAAHQHAEGRYRDAAAEVFGNDVRELVNDPAWSAVVRRLYDAEASGWPPGALLKIAADRRELGSADSVAEVMSWRIDVILKDAPGPPEEAGTGETELSVRERNVLPWVVRPPAGPTAPGTVPAYLGEAADLIGTRVGEVAERAIRERPAWMSMLGQQPDDACARERWRRHVAVIAAYRDQHRVHTDDPRQVLGPYPAEGHAGHKPYWHAAGSVLAARRLAGLDHGGEPDAATAQAASRIYRALPQDERAVIATAIAAQAGVLWLGDRNSPDEDAVAQPAYAGRLVTALTERGHLDPPAPERNGDRAQAGEPVEASLARRGKGRRFSRSTATERQTSEKQTAADTQYASSRGLRRPESAPLPSSPVPRM